MLKPNPYIYPYIPFKSLSKKRIRKNIIDEKKIDLKEIKNFLSCYRLPKIEIFGRSKEKKILNIFLDDQIRFGPRKLITDSRKLWIEKISYFVRQNKPIQFSLLGFPFKTPLLLKTDRKLPDLGEVLALQRLHYLMELIRRVYSPGGLITVFVEKPFASFVGVSFFEARRYFLFLKRLLTLFKFDDFIHLVDLEKLEKYVPNFKKEFLKRKSDFEKLYAIKDPIFMKKFKAVFPSVFHIVNSRKYTISELCLVYNERIPTKKLPSRIQKIKRTLYKKTKEAIFKYFAYLKTRDDFKTIEQYIPQALNLTFSPKPGRLGIIPIAKHIDRLPTHGVPVYDALKNRFNIEYLFDLQRNSGKFIKVFFTLDQEKKPFFYIKLK